MIFLVDKMIAWQKIGWVHGKPLQLQMLKHLLHIEIILKQIKSAV